jgi:flagellar motor switch protein FliG
MKSPSFDDITELPDEDLHILICGLTITTLSMALKTAPKSVVIKFYKNMTRAPGMLLEDWMEKLKNPTAGEIAKARDKIVDLYLILKAQGKIAGEKETS